MLTKSTLKYINSFAEKKTRQNEGYFLVEGAKAILETIEAGLEIAELLLTEQFIFKHKISISHYVVSEDIINKTGTLKNNNAGIALVKMPELLPLDQQRNIGLVLDGIADPGNLGSIVRLADWYGIGYIVCSLNTVDFYNPKVISASMGSFTRVPVYYRDIKEYLKFSTLPIYGALLTGKNIYTENFETDCLIVIGNESVGISAEIESLITKPITIPRIGKAESLNAAIATGIILDNYTRSIKPKG
jgi:RNA methyltransferase, TrmH family